LVSDDLIRRIREANDIVQVVESYSIRLRRIGVNMVALCPFHREKTPSFNVSPTHQFFKCFGCGAKGDVIKFVQMMERADFPEAMSLLAARAGIPLAREEGAALRQHDAAAEERQAAFWAAGIGLRYFQESLRNQREGKEARDYLRGRGFTEETVAAWQLGWAPANRHGFLEYLRRQTNSPEKAVKAAVAAGLLRRSEDGEIYDFFRGRVMFPILDMQQRPIGFGGRLLEEKPEAGGKYINTPEGTLFAKRRVLFGLPAAAKEIAAGRTAVVVEGYTDVIMCHQYGLRNVVATLGTSLTEEHVQRLRRFVTPEGKVVALFDADEAGEKASERAAHIFMAEGLALHVVRVSALKDACDYLPRFGAEAFRKELAKAQEAFQYYLGRLLPDLRDSDVSRRAAAVAKIMELVNLCPDSVRRAMMRQEVSRTAGVPEEALPQPRREGDRSPAAGRGLGGEMLPLVLNAEGEGRLRSERRLLLHALARREWAESIFALMPPEAFARPATARVAAFIQESWNAGKPPVLADLASAEREQSTLDLLADLALEGEILPPSVAELKELRWREECRCLEEEGRRILALLQEARERGDRQEEERLLLRRLAIDRRLRRRETEGQG